MVAIRMGPGQRTMAVPTRRQPRTENLRFGSNRPNRLPAVSTAGTRVSATATATSTPTEQGMARVLKIGSRVKVRQNNAPAMVTPEARTTFATPR